MESHRGDEGKAGPSGGENGSLDDAVGKLLQGKSLDLICTFWKVIFVCGFFHIF